jgi:hypothetical protein
VVCLVNINAFRPALGPRLPDVTPARPWSAQVQRASAGLLAGREPAWVRGMLCETRRRRQLDPIVVVDISARARRRDSS